MRMTGKKGVLLVNLGTPDAPTRSAVYRYLKQFLLDPRVIDYPWLQRNLLVRGIIVPFRSGSSAKLYKKLWTSEGSPLKVYGERLAEGVARELGEEYSVELAMRYQNPSIEKAINRFKAENISSLMVLPLFPQYASASTGSVHDEVMRLLRKQQVIWPVNFINSFFRDENMVDVFVKNARQFDLASYDHILFSYHGLPERQLKKGDFSQSHCLKKKDCCSSLCLENQFCYSAQCFSTTYAIAEKLGLSKEDYSICFQSRLGREEWVKPYTPVVLKDRAAKGDKRILVFCPAFVSDCLETTIEISEEYAEEFEEMGGETLDLVPSLNDDPDWIRGVAELVRSKEVREVVLG
ncbi:MAG: ferrochelatase [Saprospiraceae bacterium]|nr:ferrochelatase [Saprospiraceae bacterium]